MKLDTWVGGAQIVFLNTSVKCYLFSIPDKIEGYEELWFLGDNFMASTYRDHVKNSEREFYVKDHFEVCPFCNSHFNSNDTNMLSWIINSFVQALKKHTKLPKYLVIVLENDLMEFLNYREFGISSMYGEWLEYLAKNLMEVAINRCEQLPKKPKRDDYPLFYWSAVPHNKNFLDNSA